APLAPDMTADLGRQEFSYAFTCWNDSFLQSRMIHEAYELNIPPLVVSGAGGEASLLAVDAPNIILETCKPAEDGSGDVVLRLYEAKRTATSCTLRLSLPVIAVNETDMLEEGGTPLPCEGGRVPLFFRPFECKTLRLQLDSPIKA
ncbi:MAG: alpha-mannosidase, partial [Chloroflexi bacterium]|nr:alpha-mannosidase [Chloroflexota bacterium]